MQNPITKIKKIKINPNFERFLPETPGVYVFWLENTPIYIGKAINLKRRVSSYFSNDLEPKTAKMVKSAKELSFIKVDSELEALLLEAKLIKINQPKYNSVSKDDKHPLYIAITNEKFPRVLAVRKLIANRYPLKASFGPLPSSKSIYSVLRMLRRIFPYSDHKLGKRGCLYSHIGLCDPCPNEVEKRGYKDIKILSAKYRKNIQHIKAILSGRIKSVQRNLEKEMGKLSKNENFEEAARVRDQIKKLEYITQPVIPAEFFLENPNLTEDLRNKELKELKKILVNCKLTIENLTRIECFDIAHLAGVNPTASMVTFIDGEAEKKLYRHFKIHQKKGDSDVDSLREVIKRRIKHLKDWGEPDLIIVDGGKGQVKAFTSILYSNEVLIPVVGIAKNPDRLIIGDQKITLQGDPLQLVSRLRDEAHRFARRYHHKLISKNLIE